MSDEQHDTTNQEQSAVDPNTINLRVVGQVRNLQF
jgi:hypothetical protein